MTPHPRESGPDAFRVWALLHYLAEHEERPHENCRLHHINCYLRGNWPVTAKLLRYAQEKRLVRVNDDNETYTITDEGKALLPKLRQAFEGLRREGIESFVKRT